MVRYIGPKNKVARRFRKNLFGKPFEKKYKEGRTRLFHKRSSRQTEYGSLLKTRREVLIHYGISEKQLRKVFEKAGKLKGIHGENMLKLLESRLDNVVYRMGLSSTRRGARQLVNHGHISVNDKKVDIPSYQVKCFI